MTAPITKNALAADQGNEGNETRPTTTKEKDSNPMVQNSTAQWDAQAIAHGASMPRTTVAELTADCDTAPTWADPAATLVGVRSGRLTWVSKVLPVVLGDEAGRRDIDLDGNAVICHARAEVTIRQMRTQVEPMIHLVKMATGTDPKVATTTLALDEAARLAHALLLAVDVARGISDESSVR
ncbi:hypothetical protein [Rhodococcus sp. NPDC060176]|uniref:hypothetical protein n=1 Tax=Rhodococcus sp. NPDC060176 TaxID=3347062 RepID=UPI003651A956